MSAFTGGGDPITSLALGAIGHFGRSQFQLTYEISPIYLTGGVAGKGAGGIMSLLALVNYSSGISLDDLFAHFMPVPGSTLVENEFSQYPFANQAIAANAMIAQPLNISMHMICPVRPKMSWRTKNQIMVSLKMKLDEHNRSAGTYTVLTPSSFYTSCLLKSLRDVSGGGGGQVQHTWQFDFVRPLLTVEEAGNVQGNLMSKLTSGARVDQAQATYSTPGAAVGQTLTPGTVTPSTPVNTGSPSTVEIIQV
jgi:hypothetical protein